MIDYKQASLTPKLISDVRCSGKRSYFNVVDTQDRKFICFNKYLYNAFTLDKEVDVVIAQGKSTVITNVVGFKKDTPVSKNKPPRNESENELFHVMSQGGWEITKKGWPDFACFKDGKLVLIEVKPKRSHRLKYWQKRIMMELVKQGVKCYRWSPDGGFEPVMENVSFPVELP